MKNATKEETEAWIDLAQEDIKFFQSIENPEQSTYTTMALSYNSLGRARFLHDDAIQDVRTAFQEAGRSIMRSFTMAYDEHDPDYLGNQADWCRVSETYAIDGLNATLMAADFALARELAEWFRDRPDARRMDPEVNNYTWGLKHTLLDAPGKARELLNRTLDKYAANPPKTGYKRNYYTLTTALAGILDNDDERFNLGLREQAAFYKGWAQGENADTPEEYIDDHLVALGNLGRYHGLTVQDDIPYLPEGLLAPADFLSSQ